MLRKSLLTVSLSVLMMSSALADAKVVKFSHVVAVDTPKGQMAVKLKELLDQRLKGKIELQVYPNSQLFNDSKVLEAMILGDVHLAAPSLSKFSKYTKKLQVYDLPFLFKDMNAVDRFQNSPMGQSLLTSVEGKGLIGLGYLHNGLKQLSANDPLLVPANAKGKKFRIMSSRVLEEQFKAVGGIPLKKPFSEVFTLLQTKAIDGQENTYSNIYSKKFFEVQKYITESNHGLLDYMVVTSKSFWNSLDDETRTIFKKSIDEAVAHGNKIALDKANADKKAIQESGRSEILYLTPTQRQQWVEKMKPVWNEFESEIGKDVIDAAIQSNN